MFLCTGETVVNRDTLEGQAHAMRCKRWSCPHCRKINRMKVIHAGKRGRPNVMITLTLSSKDYPDRDEAARALKTGWVNMRRWIEREKGFAKVPFLAVFEAHKSGHPHMHILARCPYIPIKEMRAYWERLTGSWNVEIRFIKKNAGYVDYVCKYIGKDVHSYEHCKRWWRSHNYQLDAPDPMPDPPFRGGWGKVAMDFLRVRTNLLSAGATIEMQTDERLRWRSRHLISNRDLESLAFTKDWGQ